MQRTVLFLLFCVATAWCHAEQLLVVIADDWSASQAQLQRYEAADEGLWHAIGESIPVALGKNGLACGIGLHTELLGSLAKQEGDNKSPAGIFSLGPAFGDISHEVLADKISYHCLQQDTEAVDDPRSSYYNQIVDRRHIASPDWDSSEKMVEISLYKLGVVVNHNFPNPKPYAGSAIFLHIWRSPTGRTAGCTAMSEENLETIVSWLDASHNPRLVQLPREEYVRLQGSWGLP